ncbi:MAG TPA: 23S rRNA (adenine(2503)-C(2))-methyltransferase RlmN [Candidatus Komeilibacteria bacterium]|nr:23S rRNA (adenine(2503)-C(2))-methyltransferase RlmN [Candidatus Komeilibacteria bacterium]HCC74065.1 23S rRNA (adenine(2503)-C(2))-methyltransferase RlmN [Candidatus Komeilibacteria bacterium]
MPLDNLHEHFAGQPKYRLLQAKEAVYGALAESWAEATTLPQSLRESLDRECPLSLSADFFVSRDQRAVKALITLSDSQKIESVLLKSADGRHSLCLSSQVGCAMGCQFCATAGLGFSRNLEAEEIIRQVLLMARYLSGHDGPEVRISNIIFMGMGEPFLNYDNVMAAIKILNDPQGFNLGARHFSISTSGIIPGIQKLAREKLQINLAISLNAPNDQLRSRLMPVNNKYPIDKLIMAVKDYVKRTNRLVMFEYLMIKKVNDDLSSARQLVRLLKGNLHLVNLIAYNPSGKFLAAEPKQIAAFKKILTDGGLKVTQRVSLGRDIMAACGQLAARGASSQSNSACAAS